MDTRIDDAGATPGQAFDGLPPTCFGAAMELPNVELYIQTAEPDELITHARQLRETIQQMRDACDYLERVLNRRINGRKLEIAGVLPDPQYKGDIIP